jgi:histone H3/H4
MARTKANARKSIGVASERKEGSTTTGDAKKKRSHKYRPGTRSIMDIRKFQSDPKKGTQLLVPRAAVARVIRDYGKGSTTSGEPIRFSKEALRALQCAAEEKLVDVFMDTQLIANAANKITVTRRQMRLANLMQTTRPQERAARIAVDNRRRAEKRAAAKATAKAAAEAAAAAKAAAAEGESQEA